MTPKADFRLLPLYWSGRVQAAKVLRQWVNDHKPTHITENESIDVTDAMLQAFLEAQK